MTGIRLVTRPEQVLQNIRRFQAELERNTGENELARTLGHFRAWYALKGPTGWQFGPSKYVGYMDLTAVSYGENNRDLDGRDTEKTLGKWFTEVPPGPQYEDLNENLHAFLAQHGKKPSSRSRISVLHEAETPRATAEEQKLADALAVLYRSMPEAARLAFQRQLPAL